MIKDHYDAVEDSIAQKVTARMVKNIIFSNEQKYLSLMKIAYFILKNKLPFAKFEELNDLVGNILSDFSTIKAEYATNKNYVNSRGFEGMIEALNYVVERDTLHKIRNSPLISIILDESMCNSQKENLLIMIKYYTKEEKRVKTAYFKNVNIPNTEGRTIFSTVTTLLNKANIHIPLVFGLGHDGAESLKGKVNGFAAHFKNENPFLLNWHCYLHLLALAS